jgi:hypothetical protein
MITISNALLVLTPEAQWTISDNNYDTIIWHSPEIPKPSKAAVQTQVVIMEANEPLEATKAEAKLRIAATDWSVLPDVSLANQSDFVAYRAILRGLITNPVVNPSWPTEPQPIWS